MNYRDKQLCEKLLSEIAVMGMLLDGMPEAEFLADERTKRAASMTLINIGELVKNVSDEFKSAHRGIP